MDDEMDSLLQNDTWTLVDLPKGANTIDYKWVLKKKIRPRERESQWWLSFWLLLKPWENLQATAFL